MLPGNVIMERVRDGSARCGTGWLMEVDMANQEPRILAAGLERTAFLRLAPELRRDSLEVDWVATPEVGVALAVKNATTSSSWMRSPAIGLSRRW